MHEETIEESPEPAASAPDAGSDEPPGRRPPLGRPTRGRRVGATVLSALGVLVVVAVLAGFLVHLPYVIISPGNATPLDESVIEIEGAAHLRALGRPSLPHRARRAGTTRTCGGS